MTEAILTQLERELIEMVADGFQDKDIAIARGKATSTIKNEMVVIRKKLNAKNRAHAVKIVMGQN